MGKTKPATVESLEAIRQEIQRLKSQRESIAAARCNEQDLKSRVDQIVSTWVNQLDRGTLGQIVASPDHGYQSDLLALATPMEPGQSKAAAIVSFLAPDMVKASLMAAAKPWTDKAALPVSERAEAVAGLELEQFNAEVEEERIISELEAVDVEIYRRPDVDPSIVLAAGLED